jgi:anthranilate/para-aminobenzoate synthase component I
MSRQAKSQKTEMNDEIDVRTIDDPGFDAATAFAKLRSFAPERGCFLLASRHPDDGAGRYSLVGYRATRGEMMPPGVNAIDVQASLHDDLEAPHSFAEALALGAVGSFAGNNGPLSRGVALFEDEGSAGYFVRGCAVLVIDHHEHTFTVAAPKRGNLAERLAWELTHAPEIAALATPDPDAVADGQRALHDDAKLKSRATRAKAFVGDEIESVVLTQMLYAPTGTSDPFDAYRAWCELSDAAFGYYLDYGASPMAPRIVHFGVSDTLLFRRGRAQTGGLRDMLADLPHPTLTGAPLVAALKLRRRLEEHTHHAWGGAAGYVCPGGEAAFALCDRVVLVQDAAYWHNVGVALGPDDDPAHLAERARSAGAQALAAIKSAQLRSREN